MNRHRHVAPNGDEVRPVKRMPGGRMEWHAGDGTIYARAEVRREAIQDKKQAPGKGRRKK